MAVESNDEAPVLPAEQRLAILRALADPSRLAIVASLRERPHCVEELADALHRAPSTLSFHLRRLEEAGLVTKTRRQYYLVYELRPELLALPLRDLVAAPAGDDEPERRRQRRWREQVLHTFFRRGVLVQLPRQHRKRLVVLEQLLPRFERGRRYPEAEVNEVLGAVHADYCTLRRLFVDEGYLARDGEAYWRCDTEVASGNGIGPRPPERESRAAIDESATVTLPATRAEPSATLEKGVSPMKTRKDLIREYKQTPKRAGIFQIRNLHSGKVLLGSTKNLHGPLNRHRFLLSTGVHANAQLQRDWNELGPDAFAFEVVAEIEPRDDPAFSLEDELVALEQAWLTKVWPFGDRGYNQSSSLRD